MISQKPRWRWVSKDGGDEVTGGKRCLNPSPLLWCDGIDTNYFVLRRGKNLLTQTDVEESSGATGYLQLVVLPGLGTSG